MSNLTPSHSPMPALRNIEELSKQLEITRKRQEVEHEGAAWKEVEAKVWCDQEEVEKRVHEEKGKDKVRGASIRFDPLLTTLYRRSLS